MVDGIGNAYGQSVAQALLKGEEVDFSRLDSNKMETMRRAMGDTVEISEEARALLQSKMEEYKGMSSGDLTSEQKDELKGILGQALGVGEDQLDGVAQSLAEGGMAVQGDTAAEAGRGSQGGGSGGVGGGAGAEAGSTSIEDRIEKLEQEIEELEKEIQELRGKASSDEGAKEQLKAKEIELTGKQTELAELQNQQNEA